MSTYLDSSNYIPSEINMPSGNIIPNRLLLNIASGTQTLEDIAFPKRFRENLRSRILRDLGQVIESSVVKDVSEEYHK